MLAYPLFRLLLYLSFFKIIILMTRGVSRKFVMLKPNAKGFVRVPKARAGGRAREGGGGGGGGHSPTSCKEGSGDLPREKF